MDELKVAKQCIVNAYKIQKQIDELEVELNNNRTAVQAYFDNCKDARQQKKIEVDGKKKKLFATFIESVRMDFIVQKMQEQIPRDVFDKCVMKKFRIINISDFVKLQKKYGVPLDEFKKYVNIEYTVRAEVVRDLFQKGEITAKELKDTFTAKVTKSVRITSVEKEYE